jgi:hypothetical protein
MLTLFSNQSAKGYCDGHSRRSFLRIGGLGLGGLSFPELLRAESEQGRGKSQKALILVYLPGGPPHQDMYDIKTNAPSEVRGPFSAIGTNVSGIQICEHLPRMAKMADKFSSFAASWVPRIGMRVFSASQDASATTHRPAAGRRLAAWFPSSKAERRACPVM